jgi:hypothetical protein
MTHRFRWSRIARSGSVSSVEPPQGAGEKKGSVATLPVGCIPNDLQLRQRNRVGRRRRARFLVKGDVAIRIGDAIHLPYTKQDVPFWSHYGLVLTSGTAP